MCYVTAVGPAAIVEAFNPNTNGATALAKLMFGEANRWGKLPYTVYPASYAREQDPANFDMSVAPGRTYKYYTGTPLYPFGFGLSLTTFTLGNCRVSKKSAGVNSYGVRIDVANTGGVDGDEVVMVRCPRVPGTALVRDVACVWACCSALI